jgi:hypothetical protein
MEATSFSATDSQKRSNRVTWTQPPEVLHPGDPITLTIDSSANEGAPVLATWNVSDCGERDKAGIVTWNNDAASFTGGKSGSSPHHSELSFRFKPGTSPVISLRVGRYDDYSGDMTGVVGWTYELGEVPPPSKEIGLILSFTLNGAGSPPNVAFEDGATYGAHVGAGKIKGPPQDGHPDMDLLPFAPYAPAEVEFFYDDVSIYRGQTDEKDRATFKLDLPKDTPAGTSIHRFKAIVRKTGLQSAEQTWKVTVTRGISRITVSAAASGGTFKYGDTVTITGSVTAAGAWAFADGVKAGIEVVAEGETIGRTTTDHNGTFRIAAQVPAASKLGGVQRRWTVVASPQDATRYAKGTT